MAPSSPMTSASRVSGASDAPPLTVGTTASTSPSPLSPAPSSSGSLSPPPPPASTSNKRKSRSSTTEPRKAQKSSQGEKSEKGTYCHQCRTKCEPEEVLRCTKMKKYTKATPERACNLAWCERDLKLRYDIDAAALRTRSKKEAGHDESKEYVFACPCCLDTCQNSTCRLKKGLPKLGDIVKMSKQTGVSPLELVAKADAEGAVQDLFDGELSDPDAPKAAPKAAAKKATKKVAEKAKATPTKGKKEVKAKATAKETKAKATKETKAKATKAAKEKEAKAAAKKATAKQPAKKAAEKAGKADKTKKAAKRPERMVVDTVEPPIFKTIETRMGREEAEQRMFLREFVVRFRHLLNLPDRALGPLDDLDHALSEATVRQIAGALLDAILADRGRSHGLDFMVYEVIEERREELRHYADLARFAQVYNTIAEDLGLQLPPDPNKEAKERNDRAMRALLDIGEGESTPSWATDNGPSRRAAASRVPAASEVVRMLIAIINHVIELEAFRMDMDPGFKFSIGASMKSLNALERQEAERWNEEKKKLNAAKVRAKTPADTKRANAKFAAQEEEHFKVTRFYQLNYMTILARKQLRFEPLGVDPEGRVYYALTPRLIDEERYRPSGWARGVVIWGRGIEGQGGDDRPTMIERWMHVDTAAGTAQLAKWMQRRNLQYTLDVDHEQKLKEFEARENGKDGEGAEGANGGAVPNGSVGKRLFDGVVLPRRKSGVAQALDDGHDSDGESDLSSVPDESLLQQLNPEGYTRSPDVVQRENYALESGVRDASGVLEALEWKGLR